MLTEGFMTLMNASSNKSNHNTSVKKVQKSTNYLPNSPRTRVSSIQYSVYMKAFQYSVFSAVYMGIERVTFIAYKSTADWLQLDTGS